MKIDSNPSGTVVMRYFCMHFVEIKLISKYALLMRKCIFFLLNYFHNINPIGNLFIAEEKLQYFKLIFI